MQQFSVASRNPVVLTGLLPVLLTGSLQLPSHAQTLNVNSPVVLAADDTQRNLTQQIAGQPVGAQQAGVQPPATQAEATQSYPGLNSALWMRWSPEYRAASNQAYRLAETQLNAALRTRTWTAALEQKKQFSRLPPAIIFDIDETIFDNSPYNSYTVRENVPYNEEDWKQWNESGQIRALPGALTFAKKAARQGVRIFYITNRGIGERATTIRNLHRLGFPIHSVHHLLLKGAQPNWKSDKTSRREFVAQRYRVLLVVGDDFNDFVSAPSGATPRQRLALQEKHANYWGSKWIILPNPAYGSWERPLTAGSGPSPAEQLQAKRDALSGFNPKLTNP